MTSVKMQPMGGEGKIPQQSSDFSNLSVHNLASLASFSKHVFLGSKWSKIDGGWSLQATPGELTVLPHSPPDSPTGFRGGTPGNRWEGEIP